MHVTSRIASHFGGSDFWSLNARFYLCTVTYGCDELTVVSDTTIQDPTPESIHEEDCGFERGNRRTYCIAMIVIMSSSWQLKGIRIHKSLKLQILIRKLKLNIAWLVAATSYSCPVNPIVLLLDCFRRISTVHSELVCERFWHSRCHIYTSLAVVHFVDLA